jgi:hypothetical protein
VAKINPKPTYGKPTKADRQRGVQPTIPKVPKPRPERRGPRKPKGAT